MKNLQSVLFLIGLFFSELVYAQQSFPYELSIVPVSVPDLPGIHSYAYGQSDGKWLIIGGRLDGLHPRQPNSSFPASANNTNMYVVDIKTSEVWSSSVTSLPAGLQEQLQSTNMNFHQEEDTLYIVGGYGYSTSSLNHVTYPYLTTINVSSLMLAIEYGLPLETYFKQIQDDRFAVTGGHLNVLDNTFYLVGGHRFDGRYNPMGNPSYTQTYTNQIRKFKIDNTGDQLSISDYEAITDEVHLHRRDYNLLPQIFPDGSDGFTISSGVFQVGVDLPFLYPVDITAEGHTPNTAFNQYLSNYHSANTCMYDSVQNEMHSVFFGGMSQYYYQDGELVQDDKVPFVKTVSRVTRDATGNLTEYQLPIEMPGLKGSSAEFIPNLNLDYHNGEILKLNTVKEEQFLLGHIVGGINSSSLNPFADNTLNLTNADETIYEVWAKQPVEEEEMVLAYEIDGHNPFEISVNPNPVSEDFAINFHLENEAEVSYMLSNAAGQIVKQSTRVKYSGGEHSWPVKFTPVQRGIYFLNVFFDGKYCVTQKLIFE